MAEPEPTKRAKGGRIEGPPGTNDRILANLGGGGYRISAANASQDPEFPVDAPVEPAPDRLRDPDTPTPEDPS